MSLVAIKLVLMCGKCWALCGDEDSQPAHVRLSQALDEHLFTFKKRKSRWY